MGCISPMVIWSELRIGQYKHDGYRDDAPHFTIWLSKNSLIKPNWSYFTWAEMTNHYSVGSENDRFRFPVWNWNYLRMTEMLNDLILSYLAVNYSRGSLKKTRDVGHNLYRISLFLFSKAWKIQLFWWHFLVTDVSDDVFGAHKSS